jgi:hypothetical protein
MFCGEGLPLGKIVQVVRKMVHVKAGQTVININCRKNGT